MDEVPDLKLTVSVRKVLAALAATPAGVKLDVRDVARRARVADSTARNVLGVLCEVRLAQAMPMPEKDKPLRRVYWLNRHGRALAAATPAP